MAEPAALRALETSIVSAGFAARPAQSGAVPGCVLLRKPPNPLLNSGRPRELKSAGGKDRNISFSRTT